MSLRQKGIICHQPDVIHNFSDLLPVISFDHDKAVSIEGYIYRLRRTRLEEPLDASNCGAQGRGFESPGGRFAFSSSISRECLYSLRLLILSLLCTQISFNVADFI